MNVSNPRYSLLNRINHPIKSIPLLSPRSPREKKKSSASQRALREKKVLCDSAPSAGGLFHIHNLPDLYLAVIPGSDDIKTRGEVRSGIIKMVFAGGLIGKSYPVHDGNFSSDPLSALSVRPVLTV